jgi:predicted outer membrane repeat protein
MNKQFLGIIIVLTVILGWKITYSQGKISLKENKNIRTIEKDTTFDELQIVNSDDKMVIKPGVTVSFAGNAGIICYGIMEAIGSKNKPITFKAQDSKVGWRNIALIGKGTEGSVFSWCRFISGQGQRVRFNQDLKMVKFVSPETKPEDLDIVCGGALFIYGVSKINVSECRFEKNTAYYGGAICCWQESSPLIIKNYFTDNTGGEDAGAIHCVALSAPVITGNYIANNTAMYGGAIHCLHNSSPEITGNYIINNTATNNAGAISCFNRCAPIIAGNYISGNYARKGIGGSICTVANSRPVIKGNYIEGNKGMTEDGKQMIGKGLEANQEFKGKKDESTCAEETIAGKDEIMKAIKGILSLAEILK